MNGLRSLYVLVAFASAASAQEAARPARFVAPYLDEQVIAIVHLDLSKTEDESLLKLRSRLLGGAASQLADRIWPADLLADVKRTGATEVYSLVSLADVPGRPPSLVVPIGPVADPHQLEQFFRRFGFEIVRRLGETALFAGSHEALERVLSPQPADRPDISAAFEAVREHALRVVFVPGDDYRRAFEELVPSLPHEIGGGSSTILSQGIVWAALGLSTSPQLSVELVVQSRDAQAAQALQAKWQNVSRMAAGHATGANEENVDLIARRLTPVARQDRLRLTLTGTNGGIDALLAVLRPLINESIARSERRQSLSNLRQIGLAMHAYHDVYKTFPLAASYSDDGQPLLSWRVHVLPYLDQAELYKQFRLDESWDSPHNRQLLEKMPEAYRSPAANLERGFTSYLVPAGEATVFPPRNPISFAGVRDGTAHTILAVEASPEEAVEWTRPADLPFDPEQPARGLGGPYPREVLALFADGSVQMLPQPLDPQRLRSLFTRAGGEVVK